MKWISQFWAKPIKPPVDKGQEALDLAGIRADIQALFTETSRNKYRIEEVDIRLSNLELLVKDMLEDIKTLTE